MEDNFFCFDSNNLESINTKLYGYGINEDGIILDLNSNHENLTPLGAYVFVDAQEDYINISQDYIGSFGLYYYSEENYFAISNSFLKLMEYLRDNHRKITFNKTYADYYISIGMSASLRSATLVNEIEMLSKDVTISIDKKTKEITFKENDLNESSVPINSKEALDILDNWFYRWVEIIRSIRRNTNDIVFDLSGGFDSRLTSVIWLNANIDLTKIMIYSANSSRFREDYSIASGIADEFGFQLNEDLFHETVPLTPRESIANSEYIKFGFEKQRYIYDYAYAKPYFRISGHCGEILRDYVNKSPDEYVKSICNRAEILDPALKPSCETLINQEFEDLFKRYNFTDRNSNELSAVMYKHGRCRNHFGKEFVDGFLVNKFTITPLTDPDLQKLNFRIGIDDDKLLIALIFKRYLPKLLDFDFSENNEISQETLKFCDEINSIKQFMPKEYDFVDGPEKENAIPAKYPPSSNNFDYIAELFNSLHFKKEFEKYYPENLYNKIRLDMFKSRNNKYDIFSIVEVIKTINDVHIANLNLENDFNSWIDSFTKDEVERNEIEASLLTDIYLTARIDIKNSGGIDNAVEIIEKSDDSLKISFPKWMIGDKGKGCMITSKKLKLDLKVKAITDGELTVKLRGMDVADKNRKRFPVYINYTKFIVDGEEIFNANKLLTHDDNYIFRMPVADSQIVDVHVEWMPFSKSCEYENKKLALLESKLKKQESKSKDMQSNPKNKRFSGFLSRL